MFERIIEFDTSLFRAINRLFDVGAIDLVMQILSAKWIWVTVLGLVLVYFVVLKHWADLRKLFLILVIMGSCDAVTSYLLKNNFQRQRPCHALDSVRLLQDSCGSKYGFPSNHASNGAAASTAVILFWRKRWLVVTLIPLVVGVCYSRIHLGVHYPADVSVGALFGVCYAYLGYLLLNRTVPTWTTSHQ